MKWNKSPYWLMVLSALLLGMSRLPIHLGFVAGIAMIPLFYYFEENSRSWKQSILDSALFSITYTIVALHWIGLVTLPGLPGIMLLYTINFTLLFRAMYFIRQKLPHVWLWGAATLWLGFEYIQNFGELRFPWFNLGYSLVDYNVLCQAADIGGIFLVSALLLVVNIAIYKITRKQYRYVVLLVITLLCWISYGVWRLHDIQLTPSENRVFIMQPSIPQEIKWDQSFFDTILARYDSLNYQASSQGAELLIWPEASFPAYLLKQDEYKDRISGIAKQNGMDIFLGFPDYQPSPMDYPEDAYFYNSATLFRADGMVELPYYKNILVPVGERMPYLKLFPFLWKLNFGQANWEYGTTPKHYEWHGMQFTPTICFEIAFPLLFRDFSQYKTDFFVNLTNDAWFKRSWGTYQHAMMSRFRAIETRKEIIRSANTGISLVVDPKGTFLLRTPLYEEAVYRAPLYLTTARSLYLSWGGWIPLLFTMIGIAFFLLAIICSTRKSMS